MSYSWVDMFPWLNGWADGLPSCAEDPQWIRASVFPLDDPVTERRKAAVADLILERMDSWTIGRLMPRLPLMSPLEIAPRRLSTRLSNSLKRLGYLTTSDLIDIEIRDLYSVRGIGAGTMRELVLALIDATLVETLAAPLATDPAVRGYWTAYCEAVKTTDETVTLRAAFTAAVRDVAAEFPGLHLATSPDSISRALFVCEMIESVGSFPAVNQPGLATADLATDTGIGLKAARQAVAGLTTWSAVSDALQSAKVTAAKPGKTWTVGQHAKTGANAPAKTDPAADGAAKARESVKRVGAAADPVQFHNVAAKGIRSADNAGFDAHADGADTDEWILLTPPRSGIPGVEDAAAFEQWSDLSKVARWNLLRGRGDDPLRVTPDLGATPQEVVEAHHRMMALTANMLIPAGAAASVPLMLTERVAAFDEVDQSILRDRFVADEPLTLDSLGVQAGVTRERIRQRESKAIARLDVLVSSSESLRWVMEAIRLRVGGLLPLAELINDFPAVGEYVEVLDQPVWRVLDRLDPAYEIENGWCAAPTVSQLRKETAAALQDMASANGVLPLEATTQLNMLSGMDQVPTWFPDWLLSCGMQIQRGFVLTRTRSLNDRAAAALEISGEPSALVELPAFVADGRSERSLANALAADPRFVRVDRQRWALAEWGVGEYTGIADAIRRELDQAGGSLPLGKLVAVLASRYSVAENSVRAYASGNPFSVADGIVRMAASTPTHRVRKTWQQTRRVYKRGDTWLYRVNINRDHMRGSGSPCPVALAVELDVPATGERQFTGPMGTLGVHWPSLQPTLGSIGGFLRSIDAAIGDDVLLCFDEGTVQAEVVAGSTPQPWVAAALLAGGSEDLTPDQAHVYLAVAVGSSPGIGTSDLVAALEARGDDDLAQLILDGVHTGGARASLNGSPLSPQAKTDVDDILDLL